MGGWESLVCEGVQTIATKLHRPARPVPSLPVHAHNVPQRRHERQPRPSLLSGAISLLAPPGTIVIDNNTFVTINYFSTVFCSDDLLH